MAYRSFSTGTWQDPWFETLNPKAKLLFIYLWTNDVCSQSGIYQISFRRVEFETGIKPSEVIKDLSPKIEWFPEFEIVWFKNFFRKQCANEKFALAAIRSLYCRPQIIVEKFTQYNLNLIEKYGTDTVSIPVRWLLAKTLQDRSYGARPLRRAIQRHIEDPLSEAFIRGDLRAQLPIEVAVRDGALAYAQDGAGGILSA